MIKSLLAIKLLLLFVFILFVGVIVVVCLLKPFSNQAPAVINNAKDKSNTYENGVIVESLHEAMVTAVTKKYNKPQSDITIEITDNAGGFAKGTVRFRDEMGGAVWFAAKINGVWQLVYDGNGIIPCSDLIRYPDFPSSLIPQCFDDNKNILIKR